MKYRTLGKTNLQISVVGLGTWQYGGEWGMEFTQGKVDSILDKARETGINLIDTAECYGDHLSGSLIGNYMSRNKREEWILATKFGHHFHKNFERSRHFDPEDVLKQLDASLKALKTDYIDIYQAHSCTDEEFNNDALWTMLDKQRQEGKIRHLGISLKKEDFTYQVTKASEVNVNVIQVIYNLLDRKPEEVVFPACQEQNLGVLARVPLASGYLSGKYKPGTNFAINDVRSRRDAAQTDELLRQAEEIRRTEVPEGMPMASWALAWCLKHRAVTSVIPGCKSPEQVEANAQAAELEI